MVYRWLRWLLSIHTDPSKDLNQNGIDDHQSLWQNNSRRTMASVSLAMVEGKMIDSSTA
jgi:hypothetical protein